MTKPAKEPAKKTYALRINRDLMLEIQHLALDQDRYVNDMIEEAAKDLLKKYRRRARKKGRSRKEVTLRQFCGTSP